jgi:tetratricopeptide (TPR) repeat protein
VSISIDKQIMGLKKDALSYSKLGDFSKAQKTIKKALELKPNSKNLVHELAKINLKSKNYELSLELLLGLEDKVDKKSILYKDIGLAHFGLGQLEKAIYFSDRSLEESRGYIEALILKGKSLRELESYEEAIIVFDKVLSKDADHRDALYQKGKINHNLGKYRDSLDLFDKVLALSPRDAEALEAKGLSHDELNEYKEASEAIIKSQTVENEIIYNDRGVALTRLGYNHKAIDSYRRALSYNPKYAICWFNLGKALFRVGDLKEALKSFKQSTELNPKNRSAWNNRGVTLRQLNRLEESLDCYDRAISLKKSYSWAWHNKGYVLELLDRPRESLECYQAALKHKPSSNEHGGEEWERLKKDTNTAIKRINKILGE